MPKSFASAYHHGHYSASQQGAFKASPGFGYSLLRALCLRAACSIGTQAVRRLHVTSGVGLSVQARLPAIAVDR